MSSVHQDYARSLFLTFGHTSGHHSAAHGCSILRYNAASQCDCSASPPLTLLDVSNIQTESAGG